MASSTKTLNPKNPVIFILGATGTGKSKLSISMATNFSGEIINSDKIQVHDALPIIANRVSQDELLAAPHHLLAFAPPHVNFSPADFVQAALDSISSIVSRGNLPIVAGGSLSFVEALLGDPKFCEGYDPCFVWLDVDTNVLNSFVSDRVDKMVQQGLVFEARSVFDSASRDYSVGVRRAIGVPELDEYFRAELAGFEEKELERLLDSALDEVKANTSKLTIRQVEKIKLLRTTCGFPVWRVDPSEFFMKKLEGSLSTEEEEKVWERVVSVPSQNIIRDFLHGKNVDNHIEGIVPIAKNWLMRQMEKVSRLLMLVEKEKKNLLKRVFQ